MYLQVTSLADIVTADGRCIRPEIVECNRIAQRSSQWTWPQQPKPTLQQQDNWKEAITKHLITQGSKKHLRLCQQLGRWTGTPTSHWQYYYDQITKRSWKHQEIDAKVWTVYENEPVLGAPRFNLSTANVGPQKFTMGRTLAHNAGARKPMNTSSHAEVPKHGIIWESGCQQWQMPSRKQEQAQK